MKYIAVMLREINKNYYKIGQKTYKPTDKKIAFKNKTFPLTSTMDTFKNKKESYLFCNFDKEEVITFTKSKYPISLSMIDQIMTQDNIIKMANKIKGSMEKPEKFGFMRYVIPFILGVIVGGLAMTNPAVLGL